MKTGMLAAEAIFEQHTKDELSGVELVNYETQLKNSWVMKELHDGKKNKKKKKKSTK
jgi:flavin-dependent dehydrogenase